MTVEPVLEMLSPLTFHVVACAKKFHDESGAADVIARVPEPDSFTIVASIPPPYSTNWDPFAVVPGGFQKLAGSAPVAVAV